MDKANAVKVAILDAQLKIERADILHESDFYQQVVENLRKILADIEANVPPNQ